jgi:hypothetical protein
MIQCHGSHSTKKGSAQDKRQCEKRVRLQQIMEKGVDYFLEGEYVIL